MVSAKAEGVTTSELLEIKNNPLALPEPEYVLTFNVFGNIEDDWKNFISTINEEPISSCASKLESIFNPNSNSDNDDNKNTGSSSIQYGKNNDNDSNSDLNPNSNYKQYIALLDLTKEQEPHSCICIDLKITLEIPATIMVQLASRSNLAKRRINIRGGIIDMRYVGNVIIMLQNDSEKAYIIEPNEKITQAIFLLLVKVAQLVSMRNKKKLGITAREIQRFGSTGKIDIPVNMAEEKIVGQGEIVSTGQAISIPPYNQYMLAIERRVKDQAQIFEAEATLCESGEVGLINFYIPAKSHNHIKIPIYNTTGDVITIPEGTIIGYLSTELEDQPPSSIPDFPQLCGYVDITSQTIYR
ncbi:hypothetical protein G9A89_015148 [Geosiphon pyriformis]|nr:hypothetical protein G9A89_015148 [Geosiphon pyriformis]